NNLIEQDHRPVKRRNKFYRSLRTASTTIKGMEAIRGLYKKTRKEGTLFGFSVCTEISIIGNPSLNHRYRKGFYSLFKTLQQNKKDHMIYFEDLGVDFLFVDEAHVYKNLYSYTKLSNVAGVNASNSLRASDMEMKVKYLLEENNQRGVVFATGTPISNSMSEMFTMQKYLQPDVLEAYGVSHFDAWASTFGEIISSLEINPEGSGYQMKNRFAKFHNLPELMN